jgi:hypothetical protein
MLTSQKRFLTQNIELLTWGLILLVFIAGVSHMSRGQLDHETALGLSEQEFAGSPEIGH